MRNTILIVEDNALNMKLVDELLTACGYRTLKAASGVAGIGMAREHHPDLILLDMQMPGMTGFEVVLSLKADPRLAAIPVVALTALAMTADRERTLAAGCDDYMSKPFAIEAFLAMVKRHLSKPRRAKRKAGDVQRRKSPEPAGTRL